MRKLGAAFLGFASLLLLLELALPLFGGLHFHEKPAAGGHFVVACLGNSYTAGVGALPGQSYCDVLQTLAGPGVRTVNLGRSGMNTSMLLAALPAWLEEYRPRVALLMTGEPNYWSGEGYQLYRARTERRAPGPLDRAMDRFASLRTVRLWKLLAGARPADAVPMYFPEVPLEERQTRGFRWFALLYEASESGRWPALTDGQWEEAIGSLELIAQLHPQNFSVPLLLARIARVRAPERAREWLEKSLAVQPSVFHYDVAADLGDSDLGRRARAAPGAAAAEKLVQEVARGKMDAASLRSALAFRPAYAPWRLKLYHRLRAEKKFREAFEVAAEGLRENPFAEQIQPLVLLSVLEREAAGDPVVAGKITAEVASLKDRFPFLRQGGAGTLRDGEVESWISSDVQEMAKLLEAKGVRLLLQTYPPLRNKAPRRENQVLRSLAGTHGFELSDTEELFSKLGGNLESYYAGPPGTRDHHLNEHGYRLLGEKAFADLKRLGWLR